MAVNSAECRASDQCNRARVEIAPRPAITHKRNHLASSARIATGCWLRGAWEAWPGFRLTIVESQAERRAERSADLSAGLMRLRKCFAISVFLRAVAHSPAMPEGEAGLMEHNKTKDTAMGPKWKAAP